MRRILKYPVPTTGEFSIEMPRGTQLLHVAAQGGVGAAPQMWASAPLGEDALERRDFRLIATGMAFDASTLIYLGTVILDDGDFVGHVFEKLG